ncbi:DUF4167 domain-containing protein [Allorhizobium sp. BGMRC 0089]|uniref:DUF4167 domain-containing protein n=1 Tax=Allorhizobium sonneratiae TaxID=2934936 RepID=UPI002033627D|nr:DUF4167 domain-containing protein [Allorhizobium sonneratiae]MCM2293551.1 DUF4167 domain-containing protein [Allorhizobium sonneratiae]
MRPGQQNKRSRGRSNGGGNNNGFNRKGSNPLTRIYDSSGPDTKIRGTAQHIAEKYMALARDAQGSGDRVMAENYLQHAEHYNRIIAAAQAHMQDRMQRDERDYGDRDGFDADGDEMETVVVDRARQPQPDVAPQPVERREVEIAGSGPQPVIDNTPVEAEVAAEEVAQQAETGRKERATSRRRTAANRPRRTRRKTEDGSAPDAGDGDAGDGDHAGQPEMAAASE